MRKILLVALVVVGGTITGDAQGGRKGPVFPPDTEVAADRMESSNSDVLRLSGNVTIAIPRATVTADSAVYHTDSQTFELVGHVQLKMNAAAK